ncbi:O-methylsterigmatocystin oxidoreductase [Coprinopsis cinerea okayama7|uniref:O-methylsterigmatocystin oxidoreductase n=1 Tax=Coprinopsis cinerea (strain Okayama-7 / 130 / ATCC MYA-4618 / FGSC 9003) TaxID=240176 RepID=A8NBP6_COPC7|nr:O-methylsterigmatocystin oxidoreductase [Coprinopsis cinerea okayama7\|eukprot:XP_001832244.1 O-methylsterigmatocystin oxidoreductase [Coprinopsis cinerea okayama7\
MLVAFAHTYLSAGDMIYLTALGKGILVLNSLELIEELFVKRATNYSDRSWSPVGELVRTMWSFAIMNYGQEWRNRRRLFHQFFYRTENHHPVIEEETLSFLRRLADNPKSFREEARTCLGLIIMRLSYGEVDANYNKNLMQAGDAVSLGFLEYSSPGRLFVNTIPALRYIPSWFPGAGWKAKLEELAMLNDMIHNKPFDDVKTRVRSGKLGEYTSLAIQAIQELPDEGDLDCAYRERVARDVSAQAYTAGADTTASSAFALALALAMHPEVQRKAQDEINVVVGSQRLPVFSDVKDLPYVQAIVKEVSRWHTSAPMSLPHLSTKDDVFNGYFIPAKTIVIPNTWAVLHDPDVFPDPFDFKPERFLKDGKINPAVPDPEIAAFGYGRRICPGRHLSNDTFTLLTARLLACFNVDPSLDEAGNPKPLKYEVTSAFISFVFNSRRIVLSADFFRQATLYLLIAISFRGPSDIWTC